MRLSHLLLTGGLTLFLGYFCALARVLSAASSEFDPDLSARTLVILGKGTAVSPDRDFQARIDRLGRILSHDSSVPVIASGGAVAGPVPEAQWISQAFPMYDLVLEDQSRSTRENLSFSSGLSSSATLAILTSRYHIARTSVIAAQQKLDVVFVPAEDSWVWSWSNTWAVLRESALYWPAYLGW